jgi:exopolysaccharide biosynthesis polyprenyl glycosylphosphotransferase
VLLAGNEPEMSEMARKVARSDARAYYIKHTFDMKQDYKKLRKLIQEVDYVLVCPGLSEKERQTVFHYCVMLNTGVFMVPDLFEISVKNAQLYAFDDTMAFRVNRLALSWEQQTLKRLFDIVFSAFVLILTSPLLLLTALAVRLTSPGPAVYKQERVTKDNKTFWLYKFRTMYDNAEDATGPVIASAGDERVTPLGGFLRSTRIDELLQFFNVLKGEMSVVGPRPERPFFIDQFKNEFPDYDHRATVKAGITGYAQLTGKYTTSASDKLRFDLWYIRNYSFWLDVTLIIKTVKVLFMKG